MNIVFQIMRLLCTFSQIGVMAGISIDYFLKATQTWDRWAPKIAAMGQLSHDQAIVLATAGYFAVWAGIALGLLGGVVFIVRFWEMIAERRG